MLVGCGISTWPREGMRGKGVLVISKHTIELLQNSLHGTGATATAHGDVELVLMVRHGEWRWLFSCYLWEGREEEARGVWGVVS